MRKVIGLLFLIILMATPVSAEDEDAVWYETYEQISYSDLRKLVDEKKIEQARVLNDGWWVTVKTKEGEFFDTRITPHTPMADHFYAAGIPVQIEHFDEGNEDETPLWLEIFYILLPLLIFILFFIFVIYVMRRSNKDYYDRNDRYYERSEKMQAEFLARMEKLLLEKNKSDG